MKRAAVGSWVLILVFSGLVVSTGLWGPPVPGSALRQAPPPAPPIGSCVIGIQAPEVVPCDREHSGEVVLAWHGTVPPTTLDPRMWPPEYFPADDPQLHCWQAADEYVGRPEPLRLSPDARWDRVVLPWSSDVAYGPVPLLVDDWSWRACVVWPSGPEGEATTSVGSLRGLGLDPQASVPGQWRVCLEDGQAAWGAWIACSSPHRAELVATVLLTLPEAEVQRLQAQEQEWMEQQAIESDLEPQPLAVAHPLAEQECRSLAETYLGGSLDDREADLQAVVVYSSSIHIPDDSVPPDQSAVDPQVPNGVAGECRIEVVGERPLVGSVAGIGPGTLPYE